MSISCDHGPDQVCGLCWPSSSKPMRGEQVGNNDLRYYDEPAGGFYHVMLRDADDGDCIVVNEDDLIALRDRLNETIIKAGLERKTA